MKTRISLLMVALLMVILTACGPSTTPSSAPAAVPPTATAESVPGGSGNPAISDPAPTAAQPAAQAPVVVTHTLIPGEPAYLASQVIPECSTGSRYAPGQAVSVRPGCDLWQQSILERPASADMLTFYPYLDIAMVLFGSDANWYYGKIILFDGSQAPAQADLYYMFEIDSDLDGRGDFLILVRNLPVDATTWTTDNVQVWQDTNDDVGGSSPAIPDPGTAGNGYDLLVFDGGIGTDPDLAWVRRVPQTPDHVEFAFKSGLLAGAMQFGWWASSFQGTLDPAAFDLVDAYSETTIFEMDNTCSWVYGGSLRGFPNQCVIVAVEPTPEPAAPTTGCVMGPRPDQNIYGYTEFNWTLCRWVPIN